MESSVGTEYVAFKTPLLLEGKVRSRLDMWQWFAAGLVIVRGLESECGRDACLRQPLLLLPALLNQL